MRTSHRAVLAASLAATLVAAGACANPATGKPEASVAAPVAVEPPAAAAAGTVHAIDPSSKIDFVGSKVTGSHDGGFTEFEGEIVLVDRDPQKSRVSVAIDTTSLWADHPKLTEHLKSADFFDVASYPRAEFDSTSIVAGEGGFTITGNLRLHGVERSISFPAGIEVTEEGVRTTAEFSIQRFDFGIVYKGKADDLIRDEVLIRLDLRAPAPA